MICLLHLVGASKAMPKGEGTWCAICQEEEKTQCAKRKEGEGQRGREQITTANGSKTFIGIVGIASMRQRGT